MLGLRFCARAFSSCGKRGPLFIAVHGPLTVAASIVAGRRLSNCGSRAQLLRGMWDLPRPGLEPVSPALAGRFSTTVPPGKPCCLVFNTTKERGEIVFIVFIFSFVFSYCTNICSPQEVQTSREKKMENDVQSYYSKITLSIALCILTIS